jgi:hypothetical protein
MSNTEHDAVTKLFQKFPSWENEIEYRQQPVFLIGMCLLRLFKEEKIDVNYIHETDYFSTERTPRVEFTYPKDMNVYAPEIFSSKPIHIFEFRFRDILVDILDVNEELEGDHIQHTLYRIKEIVSYIHYNDYSYRIFFIQYDENKNPIILEYWTFYYESSSPSHHNKKEEEEEKDHSNYTTYFTRKQNGIKIPLSSFQFSKYDPLIAFIASGKIKKEEEEEEKIEEYSYTIL